MDKNVLDMVDGYSNELMNEISERWISVDAKALGLDTRASCTEMWASSEGIATVGNTRRLEYFGGFEYIDKRNIVMVGDIRIWSSEDDRVRECLYKVLPVEQIAALARMHGEYEAFFGEKSC